MTTLRDALATALHNCADSSGGVIGDFECYCRRIATVDGSRDGPQSDNWGRPDYDPEDWGQVAGEPTGCERDAATILADPDFRSALVEAIAEAFAKEHGWEEGYRITVVGAPDALDSMAAAIVARMLDDPPGWSRPHATGLA